MRKGIGYTPRKPKVPKKKKLQRRKDVQDIRMEHGKNMSWTD